MNFAVFPVQTTNIFPLTNSAAGGQYLTEYNMKSRESVETDPEVSFRIGKSFTHSLNDFSISKHSVSNSTLVVSAGRAVVDGHYIESLIDIEVDILELNAILKANESTEPLLRGELEIGMKAAYSTEQGLSGSMLVEDDNKAYYLGIQLVILPKGQLVTPSESDNDSTKVNAHLRLGSFKFINSEIDASTILNNTHKIESIDASRLANIDGLISDEFVTNPATLDPAKFYVYAGKPSTDGTNINHWVDATKGLMVWDDDPQLEAVPAGTTASGSASFARTDQGVSLYVPHQQPNGLLTDQTGAPAMYKDKELKLPVADFDNSTSGVVSPRYTKHIKAIKQYTQSVWAGGRVLSGRQRRYLDELSDVDDLNGPSGLAPIQESWQPGDYVLVKEDNTLSDLMEEGATPPSTLYVVTAGLVQTIAKIQRTGTLPSAYSAANNSNPSYIPKDDTGAPIYNCIATANYYGYDDSDTTTDVYKILHNSLPNSGSQAVYQGLFGDNIQELEGVKGTSEGSGESLVYNADYCILKIFTQEEEDITEGTEAAYYVYFYVDAADRCKYAGPIILSNSFGYATTDTVGGFLNADETALDYGYVYLDDTGHLRLLDYDMLRSGVAAYQFGEDYTVPSGVTLEEIQNYLDEFVNQRIAFANASHINSALEDAANQSIDADEKTKINVINLTITLPDDTDEGGEINIQSIESRFNTVVYLHILGEASNNTTINISDCDRIKIDSNIGYQGSYPIINVYRCGLCYDNVVFDVISTIQGLTLWYDKLYTNDPELNVNGMTVSELSPYKQFQNIDYWNDSDTGNTGEYVQLNTNNDTHFAYALESLTFNADGNVVGMGLFVKDDTTKEQASNEGKAVYVKSFKKPSGVSLACPEKRMKKSLTIDGEILSMYISESGESVADCITIGDRFTIMTPYYDDTNSIMQDGVITILQRIENLTAIGYSTDLSLAADYTEGVRPGHYHIVRGGAIY